MATKARKADVISEKDSVGFEALSQTASLDGFSKWRVVGNLKNGRLYQPPMGR